MKKDAIQTERVYSFSFAKLAEEVMAFYHRKEMDEKQKLYPKNILSFPARQKEFFTGETA